MRTAPSSVRLTIACAASSLAITLGSGCPYLLGPTVITATAGLVACRNSAPVEVRLPWCATLSTCTGARREYICRSANNPISAANRARKLPSVSHSTTERWLRSAPPVSGDCQAAILVLPTRRRKLPLSGLAIASSGAPSGPTYTRLTCTASATVAKPPTWSAWVWVIITARMLFIPCERR